MLVDFGGYVDPSFDEEDARCVPTTHVEVTGSVAGGDILSQCSRRQFPLASCCDYTDAQTGPNPRHGPAERIAGLTYISMIRVKEIDDFMVFTFPFDRSEGSNNTPSVQARLKDVNN
ncbi:unnamed protein product [Discosporangium mesarthrocarpum]